MRVKIINHIYLLILFFFFIFFFANFENSIVVKVDDQIITNFAIKNKILSNLILSNKEINQANIDSLKRKAVDSLIQSKIKLIAISKYNFDVSKSQINQYLNSISSNDIQSLKSNDIDTSSIAKIGATSYLKQLVNYGFFHADPHPGFPLPGQHADAPPGLPRQPPPLAESTRDALNNIQREIETMNARLAELSLSVRDLLGRQQNAENAENVENADEPGAAVRLAD